MRITEIRPPEEESRLTETLAGVGSDAWTHNGVWRHRRRNGDLLDVDIATLRLTFDGRPAVLVTALDVTDRLRAETALAERTALTALLADIGVAFNRPHPLAKCLQACTEALVAYVGASCARIWTIDDSEGRLVLEGRAGECAPGTPGGVVEILGSAPSSLAEYIVREGRPRFTNDALADLGIGAADCCRHRDMIGFGGCPLVVEDRIVGVMTLLTDRPLSEPMTTGLTTVAEHIALGVTRHRAEGARRLLASIVTSSEDAIFATTLDGTIISWNHGAQRLYGHPADEALGRSIAIIYPPDRAGEFAEFVRQLQSGNPVVHRETIRRRKDGADVAVALTVSPIKDAGGRITGKSVIVSDITERQRAERTLLESQELFRLLAETVSQEFWIDDA